jgi:2-polyprenyl-3-methyl-5-hydroxy-6-metoxy-1,4-benzoquinol methylase
VRSAVAACPLCASGATAALYRKDGVVRHACADCGLRFLHEDVNANLETAVGDYPSAYLQYLAPDAADDANHAALIGAIARFGGSLGAGPVLDVGCGSGKLVRFLRARGIDAYGVEPATALFDRFLAGESWFFGDIDAARVAIGRPCPVVLALDVLEHVEDPVAFLASLRAAAAPQGLIVVSTPDAGSRVARLLGRRWHHCNRFHLSLFAVSTLIRAAARAGLRVIAVTRPGRSRSLGYAARYLFEFGLRRPAPAWLTVLDERFVEVNLRDTMLAALAPGAAGGTP